MSDTITGRMEVICGQNHKYWVYDNDRDAYYPTDISWNKVPEPEFVEQFNKIGFKAYGNQWIKDTIDV